MTLGALFLVHTLWIKEVNRPCFFFFWETSTNVVSFLESSFSEQIDTHKLQAKNLSSLGCLKFLDYLKLKSPLSHNIYCSTT